VAGPIDADKAQERNYPFVLPGEVKFPSRKGRPTQSEEEGKQQQRRMRKGGGGGEGGGEKSFQRRGSLSGMTPSVK